MIVIKSEWVFMLFCIETQRPYLLNGVIPFDRDYQAMRHRRLNLERETGMHFDIHPYNRSNDGGYEWQEKNSIG
jgi:hypothetical protein